MGRRKAVLKRIVANMTMGQDMSALFPDIIECMVIPALEIKKMCFLYVINFARYWFKSTRFWFNL